MEIETAWRREADLNRRDPLFAHASGLSRAFSFSARVGKTRLRHSPIRSASSQRRLLRSTVAELTGSPSGLPHEGRAVPRRPSRTSPGTAFALLLPTAHEDILRPKTADSSVAGRTDGAGRSDKKSKKYVFSRRKENARAAGFTPYTMIGAVGLGPDVIAWIELLVIDHQLAVK